MVFLELCGDLEEVRGNWSLVSEGGRVCHFCRDGDRWGQILEKFMLDKKEVSSTLLVGAGDGGSWGRIYEADED